MASTQDTEITLGTGKMLVLFFGLVALCAAFFGLGFKMGKGASSSVSVFGEASSASASAPNVRPSAVKAVSSPSSDASPDVAFYKSTNQKQGTDQPVDSGSTVTTPATSPAVPAPPADAAALPPAASYYVQVAAVSREEDGEALVDALKKKQYTAFATTGPDKLYHVQVGPFNDIKSAEDTRVKLTNDGYNPILKK